MSKRKKSNRSSLKCDLAGLRPNPEYNLVLKGDDAIRFWRELNRKPRLTESQRQLGRIMRGLE